MPELTQEQVRQIIREELATLIRSDRFTFEKLIQLLDGRNIQLGKTTGTKIGTESTQKIGFFGVVPVVQQTGVAVTAAGIHAALVNLGLITS